MRDVTVATGVDSRGTSDYFARMIDDDEVSAEVVVELEALEFLTGMARGRFGKIQPERIAQHILYFTSGQEWEIRRAALLALHRRYNFGKRDELRVVGRPGKRVLGVYQTGNATSKKSKRAGYRTELLTIEPMKMSCECADFARGSLGLCKHGLTVIEDLERSDLMNSRAQFKADSAPRLTWDSMWPLDGNLDRLARLRCSDASKSPSCLPKGRPVAGDLTDPKRRLKLIVALQDVIAKAKLLSAPAIVTLLAEERARAERKLKTLLLAAGVSATLKTLKRKLYPYQRDGVKKFFESGRLLLADDMGLGKTTQAIAITHALFHLHAVQRGLLIVPASLKSQWQREWEATTDVPLLSVDGPPETRAKQYAQLKHGFLMVGYEQLLRDLAHVQKLAPQFVVLDEAQRIKNWSTKSAMYVKSLDPTYRLVLTGTPMENRLDELASLMDFVDDLALQPKWRLAPFHTISEGDGDDGRSGARNLSVLRKRLTDSMLRRVRHEVLSQLPSRTDTRVPIELTPQQRDAHDELKRPLAVLMNTAARRPLTQPEFLRLMQLMTTQRMICNGLAQLNFESAWARCQASAPTDDVLDSLFAPKLAALRELIQQVAVDQKRKIVVFSQWRNMLRLSHWAIGHVLQQAGLRAVFFTGAESPKLRERAIIELHDDPSVAVMFLTDAGGVGLNLQRAASCCINLELPWNPAVLEQRIGRIYRLGQTAPIDVYNLVSEGGIESRIAILIARKKAVFSSLFDGTTDEVIFDGQSTFMDGVRTLVDAPTDDIELMPDDADVAEDAVVANTPGELRVAAPEPSQPTTTTPVSMSSPGLRVERLPDGGLRIDTPPELAGPLAALLESLARSLRGDQP